MSFRTCLAAFTMLLVLRAAADEREWTRIEVPPECAAMASSTFAEVLGGRRITYAAANAVDGDSGTCWVEGVEGPGTGEWLLVWTDDEFEEMEIVSGFARSENLFRKNNRPRRIEVQLIPTLTAPGLVTELDYVFYLGLTPGPTYTVVLEDTCLPQQIALPWDLQTQGELIYETIEGLFTDHARLGEAIEKSLGYQDTSDLSGRNLALFLREVRERYLRMFVRLTIVDVYRGSTYDDTCIAEVRLISED